MSRKLRRIVETDRFTREFRAIRAKHRRALEFLHGVRFILARDPSEGYEWGDVWCLSSVRWATGLPLLTVFYTFDARSVRLLSIVEIALM
ncbi:MAG: hypothetical protein ACRDGM_14785 [bacterium]